MLSRRCWFSLNVYMRLLQSQRRFVTYVQGQTFNDDVREYFYYIDHQGMLFLDDAKMKNFTSCYKGTQIYASSINFPTMLKMNDSARYQDEFPFLSLCGKEHNYVRCDDTPFVFTHISSNNDNDLLCYGHAGELLFVSFEPAKICMLPNTGRVYHPAPSRVGGVGLIKSSLGIEISKLFSFKLGEHLPPSHFMWHGKMYQLNNDLLRILQNRPQPCFDDKNI